MFTNHSHKCCGIVYPSQSSQVYLPLERVIATVDIIDVSATVKVTQEFWQYSADKVRSGQYVFPVPARAAVCAFEMRTQDGKVIKAVAKERQQARREHEAAIQQGLMTGLVEHVTDDVFKISLGVLPERQLLTTTLTYVMDLMEADITDQVRFMLPVVVGTRYGEPPEGLRNPVATPIPERVSIRVNVHMSGTIRSIISPTHAISASSPSTVTALQRISYLSKDFLQQDFVLSIKADGLDTPRCFAETHPTGTTALQLTMVPKFNFPPIPVQEYIFLVDQSGSMNGSRIETAKNTLIMLLRSLPSRGTSFNIFTFSSGCQSLYGESVEYSELTLAQATRYVESIYAQGGTQIRSALHEVFRSRNIHVPTACFVLTDGEAHDIDATLQTVSEAVALSTTGAPLRVFTLGIGTTTSTAMCEGIARLGNGICLMAVESESIPAKCSKLLRASRTYVLKNISIDWGATYTASSDVTTQSDMFRQAPMQVESIFAGNRFIVFALIKHSEYVVPNSVVIKAQRDGRGEVLTFDVPVEQIPPAEDKQATHLIHTLAARRIIQELDDQEKSRGGVANAKETIIHLGEQYQLASRFTSFIAVESRKETTAEAKSESTLDDEENMGWSMVDVDELSTINAIPTFVSGARFGELAPLSALGRGSMAMARRAPRQLPLPLQPVSASMQQVQNIQPVQLQALNSSRTSATGSLRRQSTAVLSEDQDPPIMEKKRRGRFPGSANFYSQPSPMASAFYTLPAPVVVSPSAPQAPATFVSQQIASDTGAPSSLYSQSFGGPSSVPLNGMGASPSVSAQILARGPVNPTASRRKPFNIAQPPTTISSLPGVSSVTANLMRLQAFDGSFVPSPELELILGKAALGEGHKLGTDPTVWATVLAIAYLQKHLAREPELLEGLVEKATEFVTQVPGVNLEELLDMAKLLV
ncbi:hypothetical protein BC835DRAFT_1421505 [Cytidiella melzeri]|nr:hypothetical protein BC835DRAFT_1421505 [Cytidiella melzeri]